MMKILDFSNLDNYSWIIWPRDEQQLCHTSSQKKNFFYFIFISLFQIFVILDKQQQQYQQRQTIQIIIWKNLELTCFVLYQVLCLIFTSGPLCKYIAGCSHPLRWHLCGKKLFKKNQKKWENEPLPEQMRSTPLCDNEKVFAWRLKQRNIFLVIYIRRLVKESKIKSVLRRTFRFKALEKLWFGPFDC